MKFYFDMDGVLADFDACTTFGGELNKATENLDSEKKKKKQQFWLEVEKNKSFWRDMPKIKDIDFLLSNLQGRAELFVLTKLPGAKHFETGLEYLKFVEQEKRSWILDKLGAYFNKDNIIVCDGKKGELIRPTANDVLIDDREENISEWTGCGGTGILFLNAHDALEKINKLF